MDAKKEILPAGLRIFPLDEEQKGDVCSEAILTDISQRKRLFDLEITGLGERNWGQNRGGGLSKIELIWGHSKDWDPRVLGPD